MTIWPVRTVGVRDHRRHLSNPAELIPHPEYLGIPGSTGSALCGEMVLDDEAARSDARPLKTLFGAPDVDSIPTCERCSDLAVTALSQGVLGGIA